MTIPDHVLDEVRERSDILEVIGASVPLKRRGKNWIGLCPFHPEKTPSFNVSPDKQMYYCFGCQAGGNAITFLMEHEKLPFPDAVRALAERAGIEIPDASAGEAPDPHAPLHHANRLAAEFYHRRLVEAPDAAPARAYLADRAVPAALWEEFLLGWAPESWDALIGEAGRQGVSPEALLDAGLLARSERTGGVYDRFRGRLVFPIRSVGGKVIAMSGRRLDDEEPKYLNSADTPVFTKGRTLFNLDLARGPIRRSGNALVVEGNFDVVTLYGGAFRNVVAPLGTAFTPDQARVLRRYTGTAYLAYDGDPAGRKSAFRAGDILLAAGFAVRIVELPLGQDPDSLVRAGGPAALEERVRASADVVDAKIAIIKERLDLGDVMKKRRAIRRLVETAVRVPDAVTRDLYLDKIAAELHVPRESLRRDRSAAGKASGSGTPDRSPARAARATVPPQDERYVLLHAASDDRWLGDAVRIVQPEFFTVPEYAAFFQRLAAGVDAPGVRERLERSADAGDARVIAELELWREETGFPLSDDAFEDSLERLLLKAVERGVLPSFEPSGKRLQDALRRQELEREIRRGRLRS